MKICSENVKADKQPDFSRKDIVDEQDSRKNFVNTHKLTLARYISIILVLWRLRQENGKFKGSLDYLTLDQTEIETCLIQQNKTKPLRFKKLSKHLLRSKKGTT